MEGRRRDGGFAAHGSAHETAHHLAPAGGVAGRIGRYLGRGTVGAHGLEEQIRHALPVSIRRSKDAVAGNAEITRKIEDRVDLILRAGEETPRNRPFVASFKAREKGEDGTRLLDAAGLHRGIAIRAQGAAHHHALRGQLRQLVQPVGRFRIDHADIHHHAGFGQFTLRDRGTRGDLVAERPVRSAQRQGQGHTPGTERRLPCAARGGKLAPHIKPRGAVFRSGDQILPKFQGILGALHVAAGKGRPSHTLPRQRALFRGKGRVTGHHIVQALGFGIIARPPRRIGLFGKRLAADGMAGLGRRIPAAGDKYGTAAPGEQQKARQNHQSACPCRPFQTTVHDSPKNMVPSVCDTPHREQKTRKKAGFAT